MNGRRRVAQEPIREVPFGSLKLKDELIGDRFPDNTVKTSKYTILTFVPKNLFEQLRKVANFYFTILSFVLFIGEQTNLYMESLKAYSTFLTLGFMMSASAVMAAFDDHRRYKSDCVMNSQSAALIKGGEVNHILWSEVKVGDVILVKSEEEFPADLCPLCCSGDQGSCYVSTANLDGETNLKLKASVTTTQELLCESDGASGLIIGEDSSIPLNRAVKKLDSIGGSVTAEPPQASIHNFKGSFRIEGGEEETLGAKQLLLRGTVLRNTAWVMGVVLYTGKHTRVVMNSRPSPLKLSNLERTINRSLLVFLLAQTIMSLITDIFFQATKDDFESYWYLYPGGSDIGIILPDFLGYLITFFGLYSNLIPISLYFTCEMCNAAQALFIHFDLEMYDDEFNSHALARSTNLTQELGQVNYIFSDKTGTLTQNVMELKMLSVAGCAYGKNTDEKGFHGKAAMAEAKEKNPQQKAAIDAFLEVLAVSHTVMATTDQNGSLRYEAESPDEDALVSTTAELGWKFVGRQGQTMQIEVAQSDGKSVERTYRVLALNAFTSSRKRMSVVVRRESEDQQILLLVKGADNVMLERAVATDPILEDHLTNFSCDGLRTLVIGRRAISEAELDPWLQAYERAQCDMEDRDEALAKVAEEIEKRLELLGATAIEDKLQVGVGQTILRLRTAGIKLWVLTGDKLETARNIGFSTRVLSEDMEIFTLDATAESKGAELPNMMREIEESLKTLCAANEKTFDKKDKKEAGMMVTGQALEFIFLTEELQLQFLRISSACSVVIACRVSPMQKALVVKLVRTRVLPTPVTLSVGDGANDVPMIQEAQVGVGICGREGRQAVNAADFAISQFQFLQRLLLVHGRLNYRRACKFTLYTFWRNAVQVSLMFIYSFFSGYSGISLFEDKVRMSFNVITSLPVICTGMFDRDVPDDVMLQHPMLYEVGRLGRDLNPKRMAECLVSSVVHATLIYLACLAAYPGMALHDAADYFTWGTFVYTCLIAVCCYRVAFISLTWNWISTACHVLSVIMYIVFLMVYGVWKSLGPPMYSVPYHMSSNGPFWFALIATVCIALSLDSLCTWILMQFWPDPRDLIMEDISSGKINKVDGLTKEAEKPEKTKKVTPKRNSSFAFDHPCEVPRSHQSLTLHPKAGDISLLDSGTSSIGTARMSQSTGGAAKPIKSVDSPGITPLMSNGHSANSPREKLVNPASTGQRADISNRPPDLQFAQQKLPSKQIELAGWGAVVAPLIASIVLLLLGLIVYLDINAASEVRIAYEGNADDLPARSMMYSCSAGAYGGTTTCTFDVDLPIDKDMEPPILVSYVISPFHQNYLQYVLTVVNAELEGGNPGDASRSRCEKTNSDKNRDGEEFVPCGLQATSLFNDTLQILSTSWDQQPLPIDKTGIAWRTDFERFKNPDNYPTRPQTSWLYERYPTVVDQVEGAKTEHFISWMRPQALSLVQKPYGYLKSKLRAGQTIKVRIDSSFPVASLKATKEFVFTERRTFGGRYSSMWGFLIAFGATIFFISVAFGVRMYLFPRPPGDRKFGRAIL